MTGHESKRARPSDDRRPRRRVTATAVGSLVALLVASLAVAVHAVAGAEDGRAARLARAHASAAGACDATAATRVVQPSAGQLRAAGLSEFPIAPRAARADLVAPAFSRPTRVTNPLFPISRLHSAVLNGRVEGAVFRVETTLLPETQIVEWKQGQCVETVVSQYVAYLDGRLEEVALDLYAQADDGSVWYFGEDVFNYAAGVIVDTDGTWRAGKEGPAAMIMPGRPRVGDVHRPENIAGLVFEEVAVKAVDTTVDGPRGPVAGALVARELHDDGTFSDKVFAPGYGEFSTGKDGDLEALAIAVPIDARDGAPPAAIAGLESGALDVLARAEREDWDGAAAKLSEVGAAWRALPAASTLPPRLVEPARRALASLERALASRAVARLRQSSLDVVQASLDLQLQYRPVGEIDRARFDLWLRRVGADARGRDRAAVYGDVATLEWIRDRIAHHLDRVAVTRLDVRLRALRGHVKDGDLPAAATAAMVLRKQLSES